MGIIMHFGSTNRWSSRGGVTIEPYIKNMIRDYYKLMGWDEILVSLWQRH
jgi:hypothetical protein